MSFSKRRSSEEITRKPLSQANVNVLPRRSMSALARRRLCELSQIRETSSSSANCKSTRRNTVANIDVAEEPKAVVDSTDGNNSGPTAHENDHPRVPTPSRVARRATSSASLPLSSIPQRKSSASILRDGARASRPSSVQDFPSWKLPPSSAAGLAVPDRGRADSPVRRALQLDPVSSEALRQVPQTLVRTVAPMDILECPSSRHPRVELNTHLSSPLFVGGGTAEGYVRLAIDRGTNHKSKVAIFIKRLAVDIIGVEEVSDGRRWVFLSLASELFDSDHPPPPLLVSSQSSHSLVENRWALKPGSVRIPFCLNLPLNLGPPPYLSKQARIRYVLCPTAVIQIGDESSIVRQSWNVQMLTVHDPEKALSSLASPLLASDSLTFSSGPQVHRIKLTAGLHRQTWVNGARIFVDIHIVNHSPKSIRKIELQLEKTVLWYVHAAAGTVEKSASHLRLPKKSYVDIVSKTVLKQGKRFQGVTEHSSEVRTMELEVPRDHVTISTGRYFEIRYFVNVIITSGRSRVIAVQLPVTIIHINSLDIVPNSLAQVAAAIEAKRARTVPVAEESALYPQYHQGQAFSAPLRHSLEQARSQIHLAGDISYEELANLTQEVEDSRRRPPSRRRKHKSRPPRNALDIIEPSQPQQQTDGASHDADYDTCNYSPKLRQHRRDKSSSSNPAGPKIPRLQLSTSGLGFSETEFGMGSDSPPRKVMLSESERKMIHQQRELRLASQRSIAHNQHVSDNVVPHTQPQPSGRRMSMSEQHKMMRRNHSVATSKRSHLHGNRRSRSRTVPISEHDRDHHPRFSMQEAPITSNRYWGWNNVAANPAPFGPLRPRYSADGMAGGMNWHLENGYDTRGASASGGGGGVTYGGSKGARSGDVDLDLGVSLGRKRWRKSGVVAEASGALGVAGASGGDMEFRRGFEAGRRSIHGR